MIISLPSVINKIIQLKLLLRYTFVILLVIFIHGITDKL